MKRLYRMLVNGKSNEGPVILAFGILFGVLFTGNLHVAPIIMNVPVYLALMFVVLAVLLAFAGMNGYLLTEYQAMTVDAIAAGKTAADQVQSLLATLRSVNTDFTTMYNANKAAHTKMHELLDCLHRLHVNENLPVEAREEIRRTLHMYHGWSTVRH